MHIQAFLPVVFATSVLSKPWIPQPGSTFQIILSGILHLPTNTTSVNPNVDIYDLDLFETPKQTIDILHKLNKKVICYFSSGTYEPERPDAKRLTKVDMGISLPEWPTERWLKLNSPAVRTVMTERIKMAAQKGCDAIDPDNIDGYAARGGGLNLTAKDSVGYMKFLSTEASRYNISTGLKNGLDMLPSVSSFVAFAVNEECVKQKECGTYRSFLNSGKSVFNIEYPSGAPQIKADVVTKTCRDAKKSPGVGQFVTVLKRMKLDGWVQYCDGTVATTPTVGNGLREGRAGRESQNEGNEDNEDGENDEKSAIVNSEDDD